MSNRAIDTSEDVVDPQVRIFVTRVSAGFARYPGFDNLPAPQARQIAEEVRAPWREGGPRMADVRELHVPDGANSVRIRIYNPTEGDAPKAALVYLHGGGWTLFSIDTHDRVMREYAARAGMIVVGVDYALSPEAKFPVALEQTVAVVRWLRAHGAEIGVDPSRLAIGGDSAGANLSMGASLILRDAGEGDAVRAMLLNYGAFQVGCSDESNARYGVDGFVLNRAEMEQYWTNYLRTPDDAQNPLVSLINARLEGLPPVMLAVAECDVLAEQNGIMAEKLSRARVDVEAVVYEGATHSFLEAVSIADVAARAIEDGARWLRSKTMVR